MAESREQVVLEELRRTCRRSLVVERHGDTLPTRELAAVEGQLAREDAQKRCLAGAVRTRESDAVARLQRQRDALEQRRPTMLEPKVGCDQKCHCPMVEPRRASRLCHFESVRTLTPAASAARASVQPSCSTRPTAKQRLRGHVLALPCNFIRNPPWHWWLQHPQPPRRAGWNNLARTYT